MNNSDENKVKVLCAEYLGEQWVESEINVTKLMGGFGNRAYHCSLKNKSNDDVVVRLYGSEYSGIKESYFKFNSEAAEAIIYHKLSKIGFAPKLYGVFNGGRIEQFIEGKNPLISDYSDKRMAAAIARKLAKYHSLSMPITKRIQYPGKIKQRAIGMNLERNIDQFDTIERIHVEKLLNFPLVNEFEWYEKTAPIFGSRIVFAHNDFHVHNMIIKESDQSLDDRLFFVDYETSGYNYRSFDIGHFTLTMRFRFAGANRDHYFIDFDPNSDFVIEKYFITEYLNEWEKYHTLDDEIDNVDRILIEAIFFNIPTFLNMITFAKKVINENNININSFGFYSSAVDHYYQIKEHVINRYLPVVIKNTV